MTFPDPYTGGSGQGATQPPPAPGYDPPPAQQYPPAGQGYDPGFTAAPPVAPAPGQYPMAGVPQGMYADPASGLMIPDGTELASIGRRVGAYFLAIPLAVVTLGIGYVIWGLIVWGNGQTPALQVLGMRVWRPETNRVAGFWHMALREVVGRIAEGVLGPITQITSLVLFASGRERKSLHDHIAGTIVLRDPDKVLAS